MYFVNNRAYDDATVVLPGVFLPRYSSLFEVS